MLDPVRRLGVLVLVTACGRIDFDRHDGVSDASTPDGATTLEPFAHRDSMAVQVTCATRPFAASAVAVDPAGNTYVGGCFSGTGRFGGVPIDATAAEMGYLLALDPDLGYQSTLVFGTGGGSTFQVTNIVVANGEGFASGTFEGTIDLGGGPLATAGGDDYFLLRFRLDGTLGHIASSRFGSTADEGFGEGLAVRADGSAILGGGCNGNFSFGTTTLPGADIDPCIGVVLGGTEKASWRWSSANTGGVYSVAQDGTGFVLAGDYKSAPPFTGLGTGMITDGFVASIASNGNLLWAKEMIGDGDDRARVVAVGDAGEYYVIGYAGAPITIAGEAQTFAGVYDAWVARFDPGGALAWVKMIGGPGDDDAISIAIVGDELLVAGNFEQSLTLGSDTLVSAGSFDVYVAALSRADGSIRWARRFGDVGKDQMGDATYVNGRLYITGSAEAPVNFGGGDIGTVGANIFVLELAPP